jgi:hypothetical protein
MSTAPKITRQNHTTEKTRFEFLIDTRNYDYLDRVARERGVSISALLNTILSGMRMQDEG